MRKSLFITGVLALTLAFAPKLAFAQARLAQPNNPHNTAGPGQSEIIINAENSQRDIAVWINGHIAAHVPPGTRERIIVHNGNNMVEVADTNVRRGNWNIGTRRQITVPSNSNSVVVGMTFRYGAVVNVAIQSNQLIGGGPVIAAPPPAIAPPAPQAPAAALAPPAQAAGAAGTRLTGMFSRNPPAGAPAQNITGIEIAVFNAANVLAASIPRGTTLAVISVASGDEDLAEFVIEEMTFKFVSYGGFRVVDRRSLDAIRTEVDFQLSGDVDDSSAVSIGRMLGANIVIMGGISGTGNLRTLRARALDVQTAQIVAMASERF